MAVEVVVDIVANAKTTTPEAWNCSCHVLSSCGPVPPKLRTLSHVITVTVALSSYLIEPPSTFEKSCQQRHAGCGALRCSLTSGIQLVPLPKVDDTKPFEQIVRC